MMPFLLALLLGAQNPWPETTFTQDHPYLISELIYNPASVKTYQGKILEVIVNGGLQILLQAEERVLNVHIGPADYLKEIGLNLKQGQIVTATGSIVIYGGKEFMLASKIEFNGKEYILRTDSGVPKWMGE